MFTPETDSFYGGLVQRHQMDARSLRFPDNSMDFIFSDAVLEHVDDIDQVASEMYRVLAPGGYASHGIGFNDPVNRVERGVSHLYMSKAEWREMDTAYINLLRPNDIYHAFRDAGFTFVDLREVKDFGIDAKRAHSDHSRYGDSDLQTMKSHMVLRK